MLEVTRGFYCLSPLRPHIHNDQWLKPIGFMVDSRQYRCNDFFDIFAHIYLCHVDQYDSVTVSYLAYITDLSLSRCTR